MFFLRCLARSHSRSNAPPAPSRSHSVRAVVILRYESAMEWLATRWAKKIVESFFVCEVLSHSCDSLKYSRENGSTPTPHSRNFDTGCAVEWVCFVGVHSRSSEERDPPTKKSALRFRGHDKFGNGYVGFSVERALSQVRNFGRDSIHPVFFCRGPVLYILCLLGVYLYPPPPPRTRALSAFRVP